MAMPSGRLPKPTAIKEIEGNRSKRKVTKKEPKPTGHPVAPSEMTTLGQAIFKRLVASMPAIVYSGADSYLIAAYCEAAAHWSQATAYFEAGGERVVTGSTGQDVVSPWVRIQSDQARLMTQIGARLGLDPAARQSLNASDKPIEEDEFAGLIN